MDDGIRFSLAGHAHNDSTGVSSFNFHSIDLNAYLYKEKRTLAAMAAVLGNSSGAQVWPFKFTVSAAHSSLHANHIPCYWSARSTGPQRPMRCCRGFSRTLPVYYCVVCT